MIRKRQWIGLLRYIADHIFTTPPVQQPPRVTHVYVSFRSRDQRQVPIQKFDDAHDGCEADDCKFAREMSPSDGQLVFLMLQAIVMLCAGQQKAGHALYRKLLRNYERVPPPNGPTEVNIGIFINYFYTLSEQTMDYSLSMYLRQSWVDPRMRFNRSENNNNTLLKLYDGAWTELWVPDIYFRNEKRAILHGITRPNRLMRISENGEIWYVMKITAYLLCPMKLHYYPLDTQGCPMRLESFDYDMRTMRYKWFDDSAVEFDNGVRELPHMDVAHYRIYDCSYNDTKAYPPGAYPCLEVQFIVKRDISYYLMQFYIPSAMLVMLSWSSFWISVDAVVARVNIGLMIVLALTSQSIEARKELPRVSYIKAIDIWTSTCLVFAFSSLIEFALVNIRTRRDADRARVKMATAASSQPPAATTAMSTPVAKGGPPGPTTSETVAGTPGQPGGGGGGGNGTSDGAKGAAPSATLTIETPLIKGLSGSTPVAGPVRQLSFTLQQRLSNVRLQKANHIDRFARVLFPLAFFLFNIVYWVSYGMASPTCDGSETNKKCVLDV